MLDTAALAGRGRTPPGSTNQPYIHTMKGGSIRTIAKRTGAFVRSTDPESRGDPDAWTQFANAAGFVNLKSNKAPVTSRNSLRQVSTVHISKKTAFTGVATVEKPTHPAVTSSTPFDERRARYLELVALLDKWSHEPGDYDERVSAILDEELKDGTLRFFEPTE